MKKRETEVILMVIAGIMFFAMLACFGHAQEPAKKPTFVLKEGKIIQDTTKKAKQPDKVYQVVNGTIFYQGSKGGIYYFARSKKTGKLYKRYVQEVKK